MADHPDSALMILHTVPQSALHKAGKQARHALLLAMALDKSYIDTTDLEVVSPAVRFYADKPQYRKEHAQAYYYLGRIHQNRGEANEALFAFMEAERAAALVDDHVLEGLISMGMAGIYKDLHNAEMERVYVERGKDAFELAGDTRHYNLSLGRLASVYQDAGQWEEAASLYEEGITKSASDSVATPVYLSGFASLKMLQPEPDPAGAISLLMRKTEGYGVPMTLKDYGIYAFAAAMSGEDETCDSLLEAFSDLDDHSRLETLYWEYRIAEFRGNYQTALDDLKTTYYAQDELVNDLLSETVNASFRDFYANQIAETTQKGRIQKMVLSLIILLLLLIFAVVLAVISYRRGLERKETERLLQEKERLLRLSEESSRMLHDANAALRHRTNELQKESASLRETFANVYRGQFSVLDNLCNTYLRTQNRLDQKEIVYEKVEKIISCLGEDDDLFDDFKKQVDRDLDGIYSKLKRALRPISKADERFLCYCLVGLYPDTIAMIMHISTQSVYTKKFRLKEKIRNLDIPDKDIYMQLL
ncbi:MAG: tetratricopeptide repeat protein [Bacteroidales bacterium]|nr:tetratricopeptide repeat protein [Bacteroidales bacterium]